MKLRILKRLQIIIVTVIQEIIYVALLSTAGGVNVDFVVNFPGQDFLSPGNLQIKFYFI